eukprot:symbB.v1.2.035011.t1/scaffold4627.1/size37242/1
MKVELLDILSGGSIPTNGNEKRRSPKAAGRKVAIVEYFHTRAGCSQPLQFEELAGVRLWQGAFTCAGSSIYQQCGAACVSSA